MGSLTEVNKLEIEDVKKKYERSHPSPSHHISLFLSVLNRQPLQCRVFISESHESVIVLTGVHTTKRFQSITLDWDESCLSTQDLIDLLSSLPEWNWKEPVLFAMTRMELKNELNLCISSKELSGDVLKLEKFVETTVYSLEKEFSKLSVPDGFTVSSLQPKHFDFVSEYWSDKPFEDEDIYRQYLGILPSVALHINSDETVSTETLPVSWMIQYHYGCIGMLFTTPEMRNQGLARCCLSMLMEKIQIKGDTPTVMIDYGNDISVQFHTQLGFKPKGVLGFFMCIPSQYASLQQFLSQK